MDTLAAIILADAERIILPALLLFIALFSISICILVWSLNGNRSRSLIVIACLTAAVGAVGVILVLKDCAWPPESGEVVSLLFWAFPLFSGIVVFLRGRHAKELEKPNVP